METDNGFPTITRPGYLDEFRFDVSGQQVRVELSHVMTEGSAGLQVLRALFDEVFHFEFTGDLPVVFGQNEVFAFEEDEDSDLIRRGKSERNGWTFFVSGVGTATVAGAKDSPPVIRHFVLRSAFMGAQWLCKGVRCVLEPMPDR